MNSKLRKVFNEKVLSGTVEFRCFFDYLKDEDIPEVIELLSWIVSSFPYTEHPDLIGATYTKLAHYRVTKHLKDFEHLRGLWKDTYFNQYEYLLALFRNGQNGAKCNCSVYQDARFNTPPYQEDLEIIGRRTREEGPYTFDILDVRCILCNTLWEVEVDYIYHYPHSHWRKVSTERH